MIMRAGEKPASMTAVMEDAIGELCVEYRARRAEAQLLGRVACLVLLRRHTAGESARAREQADDAAEREEQKRTDAAAAGADPNTAVRVDAGLARPGRATAETLKAGDKLLEALDMAEADDPDSLGVNPLLLGLTPSAYIRKTLSAIRANDLVDALLVLPFASAIQLLRELCSWVREGSTVGLASRSISVLLETHLQQIVGNANHEVRALLDELAATLRPTLEAERDAIGVNLAAMRFVRRTAERNATVPFFLEPQSGEKKARMAAPSVQMTEAAAAAWGA